MCFSIDQLTARHSWTATVSFLAAVIWISICGAIEAQEIPQDLPRHEAELTARLQEYIDSSLDNEMVAGGSVLVIHHGHEVFSCGFGYENVESRTGFRVESPFVVASISKPILGTTLYRLVDAGQLDVDLPVSNYLPEFADCELESGESVSRAPNTTELLTHISGLRFDRAEGGRIWYQRWTREKSLEEVVGRVAAEFPFKANPGGKYAYSGIGTDVAARVGEVTSGLLRNELLHEQFAKPLGLEHTFYWTVEGVADRRLTMPTRYYHDEESGRLVEGRERVPPNDGHYSASGGSVVSTAADLATWLMMIRSGGVTADGSRYLSAESVTRMLTPREGSYNACGGLFVRRRNEAGDPVKYKHTGSTGTTVWIDIEYDIIGVILTQTSSSSEFRSGLEKLIEAELSSGELSSGELSSGELSSGELSSGELSSGELPGGGP